MNALELLDIIESGETSRVQFKRELKKNQSEDLTSEMVAMSNHEGGTILVGVEDKTGNIKGLNFGELEEANNLLFNWATNNVKPAINVFTETVAFDEKRVLVIIVPRGIDKPYCDKNMVYWIKSAANKRRVAPDELKRLYQAAGKIYAERMRIEDSDISEIDFPLFREFYETKYSEAISEDDIPRVLNNLKLADDGKITLAGALLFGKNNEVLIPDFHISAIWFFGNDIAGSQYRSNENIKGNLKKQYTRALSFILGSLKRIQGNKNFNSVGDIEIPQIVIEEILVNALVHRDYFIHDSVKIFIFDDRVEIKSPGKLPNNLTIDDIKMGLQRRSRNIVLTSFVGDVLPYRGIGSGILRSLKLSPNLEFENNTESEFFEVTIPRKNEAANV